MQKIIKHIALIIASIFSFNSVNSQNCNDSYYLTNELNSREFISRNQVKSCTVKSRSNTSIYRKTVNFNNWFDIESVKSTLIFKRKSPEEMDSIIVEYHFLYDSLSGKITRIVKDVVECYKSGYPNSIDTILIKYSDQKIIEYTIHSYWISGQAKSHPIIKNRIEKTILDSIVYNNQELVTGYRKQLYSSETADFRIDNILPLSPIRLDSIVLKNDKYFPFVQYNLNGQVVEKSNSIETHHLIYNKYGQLVSVVKTSNRETLNPGTDKEVAALPNASIDRYIYDNRTFLLDKIVTSNDHIYKYSYLFKK